MIEMLVWLVLILFSGAGVVAQTVAASVHELQSLVLDEASPRVQRMKIGGGLLGAGALAGAAAFVVWVWSAGGDAVFAAFGAVGSILITLAWQFAARRYAHNN